MADFNFDVAIAEFKLRRQKYIKEPKIDNSRLHVGSPLYFYCKGCQTQHCTRSEMYTLAVPRYCDACKPLAEHGMMDRLIEEMESVK